MNHKHIQYNTATLATHRRWRHCHFLQKQTNKMRFAVKQYQRKAQEKKSIARGGEAGDGDGAVTAVGRATAVAVAAAAAAAAATGLLDPLVGAMSTSSPKFSKHFNRIQTSLRIIQRLRRSLDGSSANVREATVRTSASVQSESASVLFVALQQAGGDWRRHRAKRTTTSAVL